MSSPVRLSPSGPKIPLSDLASFALDRYDTIGSGQTVFALSTTPLDASAVLFYVNGVLYENGAEYTVSGTTLTWLDTLFTLGPTDGAQAYYEKA